MNDVFHLLSMQHEVYKGHVTRPTITRVLGVRELTVGNSLRGWTEGGIYVSHDVRADASLLAHSSVNLRHQSSCLRVSTEWKLPQNTIE